MSDDLFKKVIPSRRGFLKQLAGAAFVAPVLTTFAMDGLAHADKPPAPSKGPSASQGPSSKPAPAPSKGPSSR